MAGELFWYDKGLLAILNQTGTTIDLDTDNLGAMLIGTTSTLALTRTSEFVSTISSEEATNYTRGDGNLSSVTVAIVATNLIKFDAADITFTSVGGTQDIQGVVVFERTGSDATSNLLCYLSGSIFPITTTGDDITITWASGGIAQIQL